MEEPILSGGVRVPDWWQSTCEQVWDTVGSVKAGRVKRLAVSPGGRPIHCVEYGDLDPERMGPANFNSALAAGKPEAYCKRGSGRRPVLMVLAGVHGQEVEGVVAAASLIRIMETGRDVMGKPQPKLAEKLAGLRLIVIPLANPDGRARVPYMGWAGLPCDEMTKWGQGTRKDGQPYGWPDCKAVHPMRGDVGLLGGYYDDNGVNIMHDKWHSPMSRTTQAILELADQEGPDLLINLHSHGFDPCILEDDYIPTAVMNDVRAFAEECYRCMERAGYRTGPLPKAGGEIAEETVPPPFNLNSMLYHTGGGACVLYESPHGCTGHAEPYQYEGILDLHQILFESAADSLAAPRPSAKMI